MVKHAIIAASALAVSSFSAFAADAGGQGHHQMLAKAQTISVQEEAATIFEGSTRKPNILRDVFDTSGGP